jgi:hypothetical protein
MGHMHQCGGCFQHVHVICALPFKDSPEGFGQILSCGLCDETTEEETAIQLWHQNDTEQEYEENETGNVGQDSKAGDASTKGRRCKRKHNEGKRVSKGSFKKSKLASKRKVAVRKMGGDQTTSGNGDAAAKDIETSTSEQWQDSDTHMLNDDGTTNDWNGEAWDNDDYYWDDEYGTWVYMGQKRVRRRDLTNKKEKNWALGMRRNYETKKHATMMESITITRDKLETVRMYHLAV